MAKKKTPTRGGARPGAGPKAKQFTVILPEGWKIESTFDEHDGTLSMSLHLNVLNAEGQEVAISLQLPEGSTYEIGRGQKKLVK